MIRQLALNFRLREDATFSNFVGGVADRVRQTAGYQLLVGPAASGKSHLLQAVCHEYPAGNGIYLCDLTDHEPDILSNLDGYAAICLDDVDQVVGRRDWEERLFDVINAAVRDQRRLVMSSTVPAGQMKFALPDVASRVRAAMALDVPAPDELSKVRILKHRALVRGYELSDEVVRFLIARVARDLPYLLGLLDRLEQESLRQQRRLTVPFVKATLQI